MIMDGNGRWAESQGLPRSEGHRAGVDVVKTMVKTCLAKKIPVLSVWAFGRENWARPVAEVDFLMQLFVEALKRELDELHENGVRLRFTGSRVELSAVLCEQMQWAEEKTYHNTALTLNVVMNYGGKWDIVEAAKTFAEQVARGTVQWSDLTESRFETLLATSDLPDPDLFIRTSGEQRLSNFFLWQLAYAELYFTEVAWPEFSITEFEKALHSFATRERRYGKTSQQCMDVNHV